MRMARDSGRRWRRAALAAAAALPVAVAGLPVTTAWAATGAGPAAHRMPGRGLDVGTRIEQPLFFRRPGSLVVDVGNDGFAPVFGVVLRIFSRGMFPIGEFGRGWDCSGGPGGGGPGGPGGPGGGGPGGHGWPGRQGTEPGMQPRDLGPGSVLFCRFRGVLFPRDRSFLAVRENVVAFPGSFVSAQATVGTFRDPDQDTSIAVARVFGGGRGH